MTKSREWLLLNAVECWLRHYSKVGNLETIHQYRQLSAELLDTYKASLSKDAAPEPKPTTKRRTTRAKVQDAK